MNEKSKKYWEDRFILLESASNEYGLEAFKKIEQAFDSAQRKIDSDIRIWISRYAKNNGISIAEARKQLSKKELKEFHWDVNEYIKYGRQNAFDKKWMKELENASARVHISRLEALKIRVQQSAEVAFGNQLDIIDDMARRIFTEDYYHTIFELQKGFNMGWEIGQVDEKKLKQLLSKPWTVDNKTFSDRVWASKTKMVNELHQQLTRMCLLGKAPDEAIEAMTKYVDKDIKNKKYAAGRLVMTEQAYFHSVATKEAFEELDVEEYEIVATLDSHTSEICQELDGKHRPMSEYEPGVTAPPFHVFCRSVTVPYFDDEFSIGERAARDEEGNTYYVPSNMTYKEWKKSMVEGSTKDLTNSTNSDIIGLNNKEMFSKKDKSRNGFKFISDEKFNSLTIGARKKGAIILRGTDEIEAHLDKMEANASIIGDALLFRKDVCLVEVFEETYHFEQNIDGLNDDKEEPLRTILNEILAKEYIIENANKFKIPRNEVDFVKRQLDSYKKQLEEYYKVGD
jgi:SPP1 gp7 family putative phage head morphogenesis protein